MSDAPTLPPQTPQAGQAEGSARPVSSDTLMETLELLATIAASLSDRVDVQGAKLEKLEKTAAETRMAAFAAEKATDPDVPVKMIKQALATEQLHLAEATLQLQTNSNGVHHIGRLLKERSNADRKHAEELQQKLQASFEERKTEIGKSIEAQEIRHLKLKNSYRTSAILFALLWLVLLATVPRELMRTQWGCGFLGGYWNSGTQIEGFCSVR